MIKPVQVASRKAREDSLRGRDMFRNGGSCGCYDVCGWGLWGDTHRRTPHDRSFVWAKGSVTCATGSDSSRSGSAGTVNAATAASVGLVGPAVVAFGSAGLDSA